jgi:F0F1-type ATP synthase delta subunit
VLSEGSFSLEFQNFIKLLLKYNHLEVLGEILRVSYKSLDEMDGIVKMFLVLGVDWEQSSRSVSSQKKKKELEAMFADMVGGDVALELKFCPNTIGVVLFWNSFLIDMSLGSYLRKIENMVTGL